MVEENEGAAAVSGTRWADLVGEAGGKGITALIPADVGADGEDAEVEVVETAVISSSSCELISFEGKLSET